jgi:tetratricopeptide (TPR) repeat protein
MMNTKIYKKVHTQAVELLKAADKADETRFTQIYTELKALCEEHENDPVKNHPVQWETLADFTDDTETALGIYQKALAYAETIHGHEYIASINYSMAVLLHESAQPEQALVRVLQAQESVATSGDVDLKKDIKALLKILQSND